MSYFADLEKYLKKHPGHKVELAAEVEEKDGRKFWLAQVVNREGLLVEGFPMGSASLQAFSALASLQRMVRGGLDTPLPEPIPTDSPALFLLRDTGVAVIDIAYTPSFSALDGGEFSCEIWYPSPPEEMSIRVTAERPTVENAVVHACKDFLKRVSEMRTWSDTTKH